jgi:predicted phosphodiesterase
MAVYDMHSQPRRVGLLGDIHAEDHSVALALRVLADAGVDCIMAVGDIVDGPGSVERCCELLAGAGAKVVRGNHDRWLLAGINRDLPQATLTLGAEARAFLAALPATRRIDVPGGQILLCHGLDDDDMASVSLDTDAMSIRYNPPLERLIDADEPLWILAGHTHRRGVWSYRKLTVINAGTLFREHEPCFAVVDLASQEVTYFDLHPDGRVHQEASVPLPPPRGARR